MSYQPFKTAGQQALRRFCLYAVGGRIYVQDARTFLIDIGEYELTDDGFAYRIAGDASLAGDGFAGADDVLSDLAGRIDTTFLDIRFRMLPDHSEDYSLDLSRAAHRSVLLAVDQDMVDIRGEDAPAQISERARYTSHPVR